MTLSAVHMPADVYCACTLHALSVEKEEVMGLLIGKFIGDDAHITSVIVLQRSDKRKDRVEISTEQLHSAMIKTSELSDVMGEPINVLGWYHSHPHITVQPSHVDLRTQASYQLMDGRFVGIIVSVFNEDKAKGQEIQITCFQAIASDGGVPYDKVEVPLYIEPVRSFSAPCSESIFQLPQILSEENRSTYKDVEKRSKENYLTQLQNDSAFVMSQCHILKTTVNPLMLNAEMKLQECVEAIRELGKEKERLLKQVQELKTKGKSSGK